MKKLIPIMAVTFSIIMIPNIVKAEAEILGVSTGKIAIKEEASAIASTKSMLPKEQLITIKGEKGQYLVTDEGYVKSDRVDIIGAVITTDEEIRAYTNTDLMSYDVIPNGSKIVLQNDCDTHYLGLRSSGDQYLIDKIELENSNLELLPVIEFPETIRYTPPEPEPEYETSYQTGTMFSDFTTNEKERIVNTATQYIGTPYVWGGGNLETGVDCSGFVKEIYKQHGISLSGPSYELVDYGREVSWNELQPADLMYFDTMGLNRISHISIYIGNNQMIHAHSTGVGVIISDIDEYRNTYITAKRLIE